jgi:hypothetical protein
MPGVIVRRTPRAMFEIIWSRFAGIPSGDASAALDISLIMRWTSALFISRITSPITASSIFLFFFFFFFFFSFFFFLFLGAFFGFPFSFHGQFATFSRTVYPRQRTPPKKATRGTSRKKKRKKRKKKKEKKKKEKRKKQKEKKWGLRGLGSRTCSRVRMSRARSA